MKLRITGLRDECERTIKVLESAFDVISINGPYPSRSSREVRYYVEVRVK